MVSDRREFSVLAFEHLLSSEFCFSFVSEVKGNFEEDTEQGVFSGKFESFYFVSPKSAVFKSRFPVVFLVKTSKIDMMLV